MGRGWTCWRVVGEESGGGVFEGRCGVDLPVLDGISLLNSQFAPIRSACEGAFRILRREGRYSIMHASSTRWRKAVGLRARLRLERHYGSANFMQRERHFCTRQTFGKQILERIPTDPSYKIPWRALHQMLQEDLVCHVILDLEWPELFCGFSTT